MPGPYDAIDANMDGILDSIIRAANHIRESEEQRTVEKEVQTIAGQLWELVDRIEGNEEEM